MPDPCFHNLDVRLSVTDRCPLRCTYCLPRGDRVDYSPAPLLDTRQVRVLVGALHTRFTIRKIRFTGGEPLLRRDLEEVVQDVAATGIGDIALTTNGQLLASRAAGLREAGLHRVNVSLDSLRPEVFADITHGGNLDATMRGIRAAKDAGLAPIKLNMVVMRGINDCEVNDFLKFGLDTGCHVRFLELMPIGVARAEFRERFISSEEVRARLDADLAWLPMAGGAGSSSRDWKVVAANKRSTVCGFISPASHPFCEGCRRLRIGARGELLGCLARGSSLSLRGPLAEAAAGNDAPLAHCVEQAFAMKRGPMFTEGADCMAAVGG